MRTMSLFLVPAVLLAAACGKDDVKRPDDRADLAWLDTMSITPVASPLEAGFMEDAAPAAPVAAERATTSRSSATRSTARRASSSSSVYRAPARTARTVTQRHTVRDAAIGAGAGAVLGAVVAGRGSRTKGAIVGGAAGAVLGGVIGHTVDKKDRVVYDPIVY